jgi:hypothetical protein
MRCPAGQRIAGITHADIAGITHADIAEITHADIAGITHAEYLAMRWPKATAHPTTESAIMEASLSQFGQLYGFSC